PEQVIGILRSEESANRIVCGMVDREAGNLLVYRGDLQPVVAPLRSFAPRAGIALDFDDFQIIDGGNGVRFGAHEAATDAILYENDPDYRRRLRQRRYADDKSFGASLRR